MNYARKPLFLALALLPACGALTPSNDEGGTATDDTATAADPTEGDPTEGVQPGQDASIFQIQKGEIPEMTLVEIKDVVVTSPIFYDKKNNGNFFVAEPEGGAFSGIQVYTFADVVAELDGEGKLPAVGDVVTLRVMYSEFYDYSELTLSSPADLTITGAGEVPKPAVVKAADVTTGGPKAEDYEGCLVQIEGAKVSKPVEMYGEFEVDGALKVDDLFFIPAPGPKPPADTVFTALVGQITYSFEEFKLAPRSCADYQGWTECTEPVETESESETETTAGNVPATIYDIQMGTVPDKTYVDVKDVVVSSPFFTDAKGNGNFFIAEKDGGEYSGIQVYVYADTAAALTTKPKQGDTIDISGQYSEFYEYSELTLGKVENLTITGTGTVPAPAVVAPADIATGGPKSEAYEGVLVQVADVTVTKPVEMYGEFEVTGGLVVDDLFFLPNPGPTPAMDAPFTSITGLLAYSFEVFKLSPRTMDDLVPGP
jgi:predicted extracellular nuclease